MTATQHRTFPWEERPAGEHDVLWRSRHNPIIQPRQVPCANSIFNSALVPFRDGYAGVFRVDDRVRNMRLHRGFSKDGVKWNIEKEPLTFKNSDPDAAPFQYGYDPRVCTIEGRHYVTWCNGYHGPTIGVGWTDDFEEFHQLENAFLPYNRNGVLFPRKINGRYAMLSRPSDTSHTPFGDIFYSESPDLCFWGRHRHVMSPIGGQWDATKIGAGPVPIETEDGWLLIYHGVLTSCSGFVYAFGAALLDLDEPWKVRARARPYLMSPKENYERCGDVPNVVFPCAALVDRETGRLAIYYGAADTVVGLAYGHLGEVLDFVKAT
ncbi:MAG TPA: glycoside hydrolase family 130 protein [Kiritimatiellia bacterium]|nr:glycoside hydrolase family 130 protein [Kiritimatiellia bacterium]